MQHNSKETMWQMIRGVAIVFLFHIAGWLSFGLLLFIVGRLFGDFLFIGLLASGSIGFPVWQFIYTVPLLIRAIKKQNGGMALGILLGIVASMFIYFNYLSTVQ